MKEYDVYIIKPDGSMEKVGTRLSKREAAMLRIRLQLQGETTMIKEVSSGQWVG
jgi:hypothetical protein